jgi:hypothetical protein
MQLRNTPDGNFDSKNWERIPVGGPLRLSHQVRFKPSHLNNVPNAIKSRRQYIIKDGCVYQMDVPHSGRYWPSITSLTQINNEPPGELEYVSSFLGPTPIPDSLSLRTPPHALRPPIVEDKDLNYNGKDVSEIFWRGICCPTCNRLNSRVYFSHWECFGCGRKFGSQKPTIYTAMELADPERPIYTGLPVITDCATSEKEVKTTLSVLQVEGGLIRCARYEFRKGGRVYHLSPSVGAMGGADELFHKYQTQGIPFRRFRMKGGKGTGLWRDWLIVVDGGMLGQHFMHNVGEPYDFRIAISTQSFEEAAPVISEVRELISKRVNLLLPCEFNEILSVTYMEGQHMDVFLFNGRTNCFSITTMALN